MASSRFDAIPDDLLGALMLEPPQRLWQAEVGPARDDAERLFLHRRRPTYHVTAADAVRSAPR